MRKIKHLLMLVGLLILSTGLFAANYYVATWGNDNNNGSSGSPWKTIQKAARTAKWGDVVYVRAGTYSGTVNIQSGGVTFDGANRSAILNGEFKAHGKSNITIRGFKIQNYKNGIYIEGPANNIRVENNHTYNTKSSGIGIWGIGYGKNPYNGAMKNVKVLNNKVEKACNGGWNECITLSYGIDGFEIKGNEILNGGDPTNGGEGIDVKALCKNGRIENNHVHHLTRRGIYIDGGKPCSNIVVKGNNSHHNKGQGFAIMCEAAGSVTGITVENNTFNDNTEDGIMIYNHPKGSGSSVKNVYIKNNTIKNNKRYGFLLDYANSSNIQVCNNNMSGNSKGNIKVTKGGYVDCSGSGGGSTPPPSGGGSDAPIGSWIWLKAYNGKYVCADKSIANTPFIANRSGLGAWEKFQVVDAGGGYIALKANSNGKYASVRNNVSGAPLRAEAGSIGEWEKLTWSKISSNKVAFKAKVNGKYIWSQNNETNAPLYAKGPSIKGWETFIWGATTKSASADEDSEQNMVGVYPNPANDILNIVFNIELHQDAVVNIFNHTGKLVGSQPLSSPYNVLSIAEHPQGLYFIQIMNGSETSTLRFLKQ